MRREKLRALSPLTEPGSPEHLRIRQLRARDMLRGDLDDAELAEQAEQAVVTTTLEKLLAWAASNSMFPLTFGLACCAIEMIAAVGSPRNDQARYGAEALRASPRQADFIILSGRVSIKMAPVVRRLYDQMLEPRWAISMGACSSSGRHVRQLRGRPGRGQVHADRHPRPGLPAASRGAVLRLQQAPADDPGPPRPGLAPALQRDRHRGVGARRRDRRPAVRGVGGRLRPRPPGGHPGDRVDRTRGTRRPAAARARESADARCARARADRRGVARRAPGFGPRHLPRARRGVPDRRPRAGPRRARLASRYARPGVPVPVQRPRRRLPARPSLGSASTTSS